MEDKEQSSTPFVPNEYEPATNRSDYTGSTAEPTPITQPEMTDRQPPSSYQQPVTPQYEPGPPPVQKTKKPNPMIIVIAIAVVTLLIGAAFAAYTYWYQNPEKVVRDAVVNALKAKTLIYTGNLNMEFDGVKIAVDMDGSNPNLTSGEHNVKATLTYREKVYKINGSGLMDERADFYVKLSNVREIISGLMAQSGMKTDAFDAFIAKIDNKWIKISSEDISDVNQKTGRVQKCVSDTLNKFNDDKAAKQELADVYKKNPFLNITDDAKSQSIGGSDSMRYTITTDQARIKTFASEANNTRVLQDLQKCDKSIALKPEDIDKKKQDTPSTVRVWVSRWSHEFTRLEVQSIEKETKGSFMLNPIFNRPVTIETPQNALTVEDIRDEYNKAMSDYQEELFRKSYPSDTSTVPRV